ncbi:hypothetical protein J6590_088359 [Homalodisca vitripennis]|nr:hypothetical protein J6590_088359 [Homalodisca vitripennis]
MSRRYVMDPWWSSTQIVILPQTPCNRLSLVHIYIRWNSPPKPSSYLRLPATAYLWSKCTSGQCS